jgi:hypothetical protein
VQNAQENSFFTLQDVNASRTVRISFGVVLASYTCENLNLKPFLDSLEEKIDDIRDVAMSYE